MILWLKFSSSLLFLWLVRFWESVFSCYVYSMSHSFLGLCFTFPNFHSTFKNSYFIVYMFDTSVRCSVWEQGLFIFLSLTLGTMPCYTCEVVNDSWMGLLCLVLSLNPLTLDFCKMLVLSLRNCSVLGVRIYHRYCFF